MSHGSFPGENNGIHRITVNTPVTEIKVNVYLIEDAVPTLIDAPPGGRICLEGLRAGLAPFGYRVEDIGRIIVTHPHFDHYGLAQTIADMSGAEVWASGSGSHWMEDYEGELKREEDYRKNLLRASGASAAEIEYVTDYYARANRLASGAKVSRRLGEGDSFSVASRVFTIEEVPGHTPWCLLIRDAVNNLAFTGDFLFKGIAANPVVQWTDLGRPGYNTMRSYLSSLKKVKQMELKTAFPGHGEVIVDPSLWIERSCDFIGKRKLAVLTILRKGRQTPCAISQQLFPRLPRAGLFRAVSDVMGHLEILEEEVLAVREEGSPIHFVPV